MAHSPAEQPQEPAQRPGAVPSLTSSTVSTLPTPLALFLTSSTNPFPTRPPLIQTADLTNISNVDRILTGSPQSDPGMLSFKEYGLLVCEAIVLRGIADRTFPRQVFRAFLDDFQDLIDNESGVGRQVRVADRMRWAYARWL